MKHSRLILKCIATAALGTAFVLIAGLVVAMTPIYLALSMKGHSKLGSLVPLIPLGIIGTTIWKIWQAEPMTETELAYHDGIRKGQIKAARKLGEIEGAKIISQPEDLSIRPVYALTQKSLQTDEVPF